MVIKYRMLGMCCSRADANAKQKANVMRGPQRYYGKSCQQCVELLQFNPRTLLIVNSVKKEGCHVVVSPKMCRPNDYMEYVNLVQSNIKLMAN